MNSAAANRARVAQFQADRRNEHVGPGLDGCEVVALSKIVGPIGAQGRQGHTEYAGGWKATKFKVGAS